MYRDQRNYENLNRAKFIGAGAFDIPRIAHFGRSSGHASKLDRL